MIQFSDGLGTWWGSINWGSADGWFAGIITAATLLLAILILLKDRRQQNRKEADSFATWTRFTDLGDGTWGVTLECFNAGRKPVPYAVVIGAPDSELEFSIEFGDGKPIRQGEGARIKFHALKNPRHSKFYVIFADTSGRTWTREVRSGRYIAVWKRRRWLRTSLRAIEEIHPPPP